MKQYIDKATLVAEIKRQILAIDNASKITDTQIAVLSGNKVTLTKLLSFIDTLEVKEMKEAEEKFERPNIKIKDAIEVSSRMKYIDEDLKPVANFIMDYASWNLHKDEWNHPVLEVPLFRVLDALAQRGKPYCCAD